MKTLTTHFRGLLVVAAVLISSIFIETESFLLTPTISSRNLSHQTKQTLSKNTSCSCKISATKLLSNSIALVVDRSIDGHSHIILPGETRTIHISESFSLLVEKTISEDYGVLAVGIDISWQEQDILNDDDKHKEEEEYELLEMASLCEIQHCTISPKNLDNIFNESNNNSNDDGILTLTVKCIGRIQIEGIAQEYPYWKFFYSIFEDEDSKRNNNQSCSDNHLPQCRLVADNIETFIQKLSNEEEGTNVGGDTLLQRFNTAYQNAFDLHNIGDSDTSTTASSSGNNKSHHQYHEVRSLTAMSWAAFTAVSPIKDNICNSGHSEDSIINPHKYRLRALDYDTLFDRLKLAQYMLREIELRMQGNTLMTRTKKKEQEESKEYLNYSYWEEVESSGFQ